MKLLTYWGVFFTKVEVVLSKLSQRVKNLAYTTLRIENHTNNIELLKKQKVRTFDNTYVTHKLKQVSP